MRENTYQKNLEHGHFSRSNCYYTSYRKHKLEACNFIKKEFCEISKNTFLRIPLYYWKFNMEVAISEFFEKLCHLIIDQKAKE